MKIKKKIKKKSGSKTEILRNLEAQPKRLVSYKKKRVYTANVCDELVKTFQLGLALTSLLYLTAVL